MSQIKKGAILSYTNLFITNIIGLALTPLIVRSLGTNEYGLYILIGSLIAYFSLLDFGVGDTVVRYISRFRATNSKDEEASFLGSIILLFLPIILFIFLLGTLVYFNIEKLFGANFKTDDVILIKKMFLILLFNLSFSLLGNIFLGYINSYERFVFTKSVVIIKYLVRAVIIYFVLENGGMAMALVVIDTILNVLFFAINVFYSFHYLQIKFVFKKLDISFVKELFSFSAWLFLLSVIGNFQWQGGQVLLGFISSSKEISVYSIGVLLGTYYSSFSSALSSMFLPHASRLTTQNVSGKELTDAMIKLGRVTSYILMLILSGFIIFGKAFILLWLGKEFLDAYYIALIIMLVYTFPLVQSYATAILEAKRLVKYKGSIYLVFIVLGTCCGYFGYYYASIIGVITSICAGWFIAFVLLNVYYSKKLELQIFRFFKEVFVHQMLPLIGLFGTSLYFYSKIHIQSWVVLAVSALSYSLVFGAIYFLFILDSSEKLLISHRYKPTIK
jgi:O-antigen/teichoic acid export membrane protein